MTQYYYFNSDEKLGPFSFDELKDENINPQTMIWFEGLEDWTHASEIEDIKPILELKPPPIQTSDREFAFDDINKYPQKTGAINRQNKKDGYVNQGMFSSPFAFQGRIRRMEYGISFIIYVVGAVIINNSIDSGDFPILILGYIPLLWFFWGQGAKRCHDMGNSGWYQIIPFYIFWMLFSNSDSGINEYGKNPKD